MKYKAGRFSKDDLKFITDNSESMTYIQIAHDLNRKPDSIREYIEETLGQEASLRKGGLLDVDVDITSKPYWSLLEEQFTKKELNLLIFEWQRVFEQFRQDILPIEESQVLEMIKLGLLMNRNLVAQKKSVEDVEEMGDLLKKLRDDDTPNPMVIQDILMKMAIRQTAQGALNKDYRDMQDKKNKMYEILKATRNSRVKRYEDMKESMTGWIQQVIKDLAMREKLGIDMEKMRLAANKELARLSEYHKYEDGEVDQPILNCDTIREDNV